jgi:hypothetical protein
MRLVEDPVRFARAFAPVRRGLLVGATAVVVPLLCATVLLDLTSREAPAPVLGREQVDRALSSPVHGAELTGVSSGSVLPSPRTAYRDVPRWRNCLLRPAVVETPADCSFGDAGASRRIVLFGDSHAAQWLSPLAEIASRDGYRLDLRAKESCPPAEMTVVSVTFGREYRECDQWRSRVLDEVGADPPAFVVTASYDYISDRRWVPGWSTVVNRLLASGTEVLYLRPTPLPDFDVPTCLSGALNRWQDCALPAHRTHEDPMATLIAAGRYPGAQLVDVTDHLCTAQGCPAVRDHVLIYRDRSHLTDTAARGLEPVLFAALWPMLSS